MVTHLGMLYPGHSGEGGLSDIGDALGPEVVLHVAHTRAGGQHATTGVD